MGGIVRRVAIALSIVVAAITLWYRRVDRPAPPDRKVARLETKVVAVDVAPSSAAVTVTLPFDDVLAAASEIRPGGRIDILLVPKNSAAARLTAARAETVAEDVRVLEIGAVERRLDSPDAGAKAVPLTVAVKTREEAGRLFRAMRRGDLRYTLRGHPGNVLVDPFRPPMPTPIAAATAEAPCTNRRGNTAVYDAVRLTCANQARAIFVDSSALERSRKK